MQYGPSIPAFRDVGKEAVTVCSTRRCRSTADESATIREALQSKFGPNAGTFGCQPYEARNLGAAAAMAAARGTGNDAQIASGDRMRAMIHRGVNGTTRLFPTNRPPINIPCRPRFVAGMPHQFLQIQDFRRGRPDRSGTLYDRQVHDAAWIKA